MEFLFGGVRERRELRLSGVSGIINAPPVFGRLYTGADALSHSVPDGSVLCIFEPDLAMPSILLSRPCAVITSSPAVSSALLELLTSAHIPYLILNDIRTLDRAHSGKLALVDTKNGLLIIDPQLDTLNSYPQSAKLSELNETPLSPYLLKEKNGKGLLLNAEGAQKHGELFDLLTELAESPHAPPVTVELKLPKNGQERETFSESVEAIFRAAIYGSFSLLLSSYSSSADISAALGCMHEVFCSLEESGREFNGYIKKGLIIDSPLWLMRQSPMKKPDIICLDLEQLLPRLFGDSLNGLADLRSAEHELYGAWRHYADFFAPDCRLIAKHSPVYRELCDGFIVFSGISEVYTKPDGTLKI